MSANEDPHFLTSFTPPPEVISMPLLKDMEHPQDTHVFVL